MLAATSSGVRIAAERVGDRRDRRCAPRRLRQAVSGRCDTS